MADRVEVNALVWDSARRMLWRAMVDAWDRQQISREDSKFPLVDRMLPSVLAWTFAHHPDLTLLADCRQLALEHGRDQLAQRIVLAMVDAIALKHPMPAPEPIPPTPAWYLWYVEHVWHFKPGSGPQDLVRSLRGMAHIIEKRAKAEGYLMKTQRQLSLELLDPSRRF